MRDHATDLSPQPPALLAGAALDRVIARLLAGAATREDQASAALTLSSLRAGTATPLGWALPADLDQLRRSGGGRLFVTAGPVEGAVPLFEGAQPDAKPAPVIAGADITVPPPHWADGEGGDA